MKLNRLSLYKLRNLAHFEFCSEVKTMVSKHTAEKLNITEAFAEFCELLELEKKGLELIAQHELTAKISEIDEQRDNIYRGLTANIKSLCLHFDATMRENAEKLVLKMGDVGEIVKASYNEETAGLHKITTELLGASAEQTKALGLTDWVKYLQTLNEEFRKLMQTRNAELSSEEPIHMRSLRTKINKVYKQMQNRIEASALLNGDTDYKAFINELNGRIDYYKEYNMHSVKKVEAVE